MDVKDRRAFTNKWVGKVHCGDALYLMGKLPDKCIGGVITDPPYVGHTSQPGTTARKLSAEFRPYAHEFYRLTRYGGTAALITGAQTGVAWVIAMEEAGFTWLADLPVLWDTGQKAHQAFGSLSSHVLWFVRPGARHTWNSKRKSIQSNVIVCSKVPVQERRHPAQKPLELTNFLVSLLTRPDDVILDPFAGSGGTLVSAEIVGRPFIGFDKDKACTLLARKRIRHWELEEERPIHLWFSGRVEEL